MRCMVLGGARRARAVLFVLYALPHQQQLTLTYPHPVEDSPFSRGRLAE
jgi:hypothetical protein